MNAATQSSLCDEQVIQEHLNAGLAHHRAGRLPEASAHYSSILQADPGNADALNLTGVIARQRGDLAASERLISQAIRENAWVATYFHNLARTVQQLGRQEEAMHLFRKAISLNPKDGDSFQQLALLMTERGETEQAVGICRQWTEVAPEQFQPHFSLGCLLHSRGDRRGAIESLQRAVASDPARPQGHIRLADVLAEDKQLDQAVSCYQEALRLDPEDAATFHALALVQHQMWQNDAARRSYVAALQRKPNFPEALSNLGALLIEMREFEAADALLTRALAEDPNLLNISCNLATLALRRGDTHAAIAHLRKVLEADPAHPEALCTLGFTLDTLGDDSGAAACFRLALESRPDLPAVRFNLSTHILCAGDFDLGWREYEMRWAVRQFATRPQLFTQPQWQGEDPAGRRLYLYWEQGLGDTLHFFRYALLLVERGASITLLVQPLLFHLLLHLHPAIDVIRDPGHAPAHFDFHCPLMTLPGLFQTDLSNLPAEVPYLRVPSHAAAKWSSRLPGKSLRVGLVWSGNPEHTRDRIRSLHLRQMLELISTPGATFYSLQKGPGRAQLQEIDPIGRVLDLGEHLEDFTDTAAVLDQLDLLISVDTAVVHLAGALARPVWILVPHSPDWRWLRDRTDSPWYPTAKLFRQTALGRWDDVLESVRAELEILIDRETSNFTRVNPRHMIAPYALQP